MIAAAYDYATGERRKSPHDFLIVQYMRRFGSEAVFGRALNMHELHRFSIVENIIETQARLSAAKDASAWKKQNPEAWDLLDWAAGCAKQEKEQDGE